MNELSNKQLNEIANRLKNAINPIAIYLFGSYAVDQAENGSDIDLLAVVPETKKPVREIAIEGRKSLMDIHIPLDLIVCTKLQFDRFRDVKNSIINEAFCFGRIIYGS